MITDKEEAIRAIRTKKPNVLDEISIELQNDFDVATAAADTFEMQLRNFISIGSSGDGYWKKARDIIRDWDHSAQIYRQKEERAKARGLIIDEDKALKAIRAGEAKLGDIMPEIVDSKMVLEAIKQYGNSQYTYAQQIGVRGIDSKEFRTKVKEISEERAKWAKVDRDYKIREAQAKARGLIIDEEEAIKAIRAGEARLRDIMPEIVDSEMVLEAIKQYGNGEHVYAKQIGARGIDSKEFRAKAKEISEERAKWAKVDRDYAMKEAQAKARGLIIDEEEALKAIRAGEARLADIMPEIVDSEMVLEAVRQYGNSQYTYAQQIGARGIEDKEFRTKVREISQERAKASTKVDRDHETENDDRTVLENKLMEEFEQSKAKEIEIEKKSKAIEGLKALEQKYEKEISKAEGKVF